MEEGESPKKEVMKKGKEVPLPLGNTTPSKKPHTLDVKLPLLYRRDLLSEGKDCFFAPLNIPFERRLQTGVIVLWLLALPLCLAVSLVVAVALFLVHHYLSSTVANVGIGLVCAYLATYAFNRPYQRKGARWRRFVGSALFTTLSNLFCQYFPSRLLFDGLTLEQCESAELVAERFLRKGERYLFCCHPHGLFGLGIWGAFVANPGNIRGGHVAFRALVHSPQRLFQCTIHTMTANFRLPVWREWLLSLGFCDVEKKTLLRCLRRDETSTLGHIACLVPGGAAESVTCTEPTLVLRNRKGFVKIALETGCHLVPIYTFGETKLYKPWTRNRRVLGFLQRVQKLLGVGTPLVCGRGIFNYGFGFLPHREMLTTVVGVPIPVPKLDVISSDDVDRFHQRYVDALMDLYRRHQPLYDPTGPEELQLR